MAISALFPSPRPVALAGRTLLASELRVRDLAYLEALAVAGTPRPGEGGEGDGPEALRLAYDGALAWPPEWGGAIVSGFVFNTLAGRAALLGCVLRVEGPDAGALVELAAALSAEEWAAVDRVAFAADPFDVVSAKIDRSLGFDPPRRTVEDRVPWPRAAAEFLRAFPGWSLEAVGDLTLSQFALLRSGGEPADRSEPLPGDPDEAERLQSARAAFWRAAEAGPEGDLG